MHFRVKEKSPQPLSLSLQQGKWHWAFLHDYILGEKKELSVQCDEKTGFQHHHSSIPFKVIMYIPQGKREPFTPAAVAPIWFGGVNERPNLKQGVGRTEVIVPKNWCFVQCVKPRNGCMTTTLQTWQMTQSLQVFCQNSACANKRKLRMSCEGIFCHKAAFGLLGLIFFRASSSATHPKKVKTYKKKTGYTRVKGYIM